MYEEFDEPAPESEPRAEVRSGYRAAAVFLFFLSLICSAVFLFVSVAGAVIFLFIACVFLYIAVTGDKHGWMAALLELGWWFFPW